MKERLVNIIGIVVPLVFLFILSASLIRSIRRSMDAKRLIDNTQSRLQKAINENMELEEKLSVAQSEQFVEEQLRNKWGLVREGEIVLVLPDPEILKKLSPTIPEEEEVRPLPNWKKWVELFI